MKVTGQYKHWYNIEYIKPIANLDKYLHLIQVRPGDSDAVEYGQGLDSNDHSEEVLIAQVSSDKAKAQHIESWTKNCMYTVVKDEGQKTISTSGVYSLKSKPNGTMQKARLVVMGFEEDCLNDLEKDSPTCSKEAFQNYFGIYCSK